MPGSPPSPASGKAWRGRSHGGGFGALVAITLSRLGLIPCYALLAVPALWYLVADRPARRASLDWWRQMRPGLGRWGRLVMAYRHFYSFARILADRMLAFTWPEALRRTHRGVPGMRAAMHDPRGCILLSAHVGNWELSGRWLTRYRDVPINIVMLQAEAPQVRAQLARVMGDHPYRVIDLADPTTAGLAIVNALARGETCCMLGDRTAGDDRNTVRLPFLGRPARFPLGPFAAAAVTGAPIVPTFALKESLDRYVMTAWPAIRIPPHPRRQRRAVLTEAVRQWVRVLTWQVRTHPLQWHNFYDFWDHA